MNWAKSELQILKSMGIDMWHQSLHLTVAHDEEFQSIIAEVEPISKTTNQISNTDSSVSYQAQSVPQSSKAGVAIATSSDANKHGQSASVTPSSVLPSTKGSVKQVINITVQLDAKRIDAIKKIDGFSNGTWGNVEQHEKHQVDKDIQTSLKSDTLFDSGQKNVDLLILQWLKKEPTEQAFLKSFTENCCNSLSCLGIESVLSIGFNTNAIHQTEPQTEQLLPMLQLIYKTIKERQIKHILICGSPLASVLLNQLGLVYQFRGQRFNHVEGAIPSAVTVDLGAIAAVPKMKALLWQDLKCLIQAE